MATVSVIPTEAREYIQTLLASQVVLKIKRDDLEVLYRLGYVDGGLKVFSEVQRAMTK